MKMEAEERIWLPFDLKGQLSNEMIHRAELELGETPKTRQLGINTLKSLIKINCKNWPTEEAVLLMFLRARKFDAARAFQLMDNFYGYKEKHYDLRPFTLEDVMTEVDYEYFCILPYRDPYDRIIGTINIGNFDPDKTPLPRALNFAVAVASKILEEPGTQITGVCLVVDCKNINWRHLKCISGPFSRLLVYTFQNSFPARYKACHLINVNILVKMAYKLLKIWLQKKLRSRIYFHDSDMSSLHRHIPPFLLPSEFGGTLDMKESVFNPKDLLNAKLLS